ncbi:hypothetical protein NUU61_007058 [Penicillium alfredii]|uniref:NADH-ubiquinone oxidoreductase 178 kDa subunit n=1 Tax=Penicillium alfredii TaxID=1506179 RepID=A0A9W9K3W6_9EURO|nr:uncharacterized protein NUU61_007058 [Penicillium alfredii]KAJ5092188.1 hypothetical protein NUU61_007058 [Penicillium alfredii]
MQTVSRDLDFAPRPIIAARTVINFSLPIVPLRHVRRQKIRRLVTAAAPASSTWLACCAPRRARERRLRRKLSPSPPPPGDPIRPGLATRPRSFYVTIGSFASAYLLYRVSKSNQESDSPSWISSFISKWTPSQEVFEERNAIRTAVMEKAAHDRHLFQSQGPREAYDLKQPEMMNAGSPFNVSPGSQADLSAVVAHYQRQNKEMEDARIARTKDGKVVSLYD